MPRHKKPSPSPTQLSAPNEPVELSIGDRIKAERERLGLDFEQLSVLTAWCDQGGTGPGIAAVTLRRYERQGGAKTLPGLRELRILCHALGVSADRLLLNRPTDTVDDLKANLSVLRSIAEQLCALDELSSIGSDTDAVIRQAQLRRARLRQRPGEPGADSLLD